MKFASSADATDRRQARDAVDASYEQSLAAPGLQQLSIPDGDSIAEAAIALRANPNVEFVSTPGKWYANEVPPDPFYNDAYLWTQWGMHNTGQVFASEAYANPNYNAGLPVSPSNPIYLYRPLSGGIDKDIDAPEAWQVATTGSEPVAVIDTGVAYQHGDLAANIYGNVDEVGGVPELDDDLNGFEDDEHGWDFTGDLAEVPPVDVPETPEDESLGAPTLERQPPDASPSDPDGHGTHVASILGATADNAQGIAGVNPRAQIMPLRAADETGAFTWAAIAQATSYALSRGVRVINGSFGGSDPDPAFEAIVNANPQALFIFSAGNGGADHLGDNHDSLSGLRHSYPCDMPAENVICVAATDWNDQLARFSDYGYNSVDISAPGTAVFGAKPTPDGLGGGIGDFKFLDGTSMSAPMVSGAAALIWGANPSLESSQIKTLLVNNSDPLPALAGKVGFGGRLNVGNAAIAAANPPAPGWPSAPQPPPPGPDDNEAGIAPGDGDAGGGAQVLPGEPIIHDVTPPSFSLVKPKAARVGSDGRVRFRVRCRELCSVKVLARTDVAGMKPLRVKASVKANSSRLLSITFRGKQLKALRARIAQNPPVRIYFSVTVTDTAGNRSGPRKFTVKLSR